jgi:hypothetical protein
MAIDSLATWKSTYKTDVVPTNSPTWPQVIADWMNARVTSKMSLPGIGGPGFSFTFDKSTFATQLATLTPNNDQDASMDQVASAWETAILSSTPATAVGSFIIPATPATTWSVVNSTIIDAASIASAKDKVKELKNLVPEEQNEDPQFPVKFYEAFLLLTVTTDGLNSVSPPAGPNPLTDAARAVA